MNPTVGGSAMATPVDLGYVGGLSTRAGQTMAEPGGQVFYKFTTLGSSTTANYVRISFTNAEGDLYLKVYRADGTQVGVTSDGTTGTETVSLAGQPEGTYHVEVGSAKGDVSRNYSLTIAAPTAPDLTVTAGSSDVWQSATPGTMVDWTATIKNNGPGQQRADWTVYWYLSPLPYLSTSAAYAPTLVCNETYSDDIPPLGSVSKTYSEAVPNIEKVGQKYLLAKVINGGPDYYATNNTKASTDLDWFGTVAPDAYDAAAANNDLASATDLGYVAGTTTRAALTLDSVTDKDFYKFTTLGNSTAANYVRINFNNAEGDLYLKVYRENGTQVGTTYDGTTGTETVSLAGLPEGTYCVEVGSAKGDVSRNYSLTISAPAAPDLTVTAVSSDVWQSAAPGTVVDWTATIKNNGPGQQRADWTVEWYLSPLPYLSTSAAYLPTLIDSQTYSDDIPPLGSVSKTYSEAVPAIAAAGQKYVIARVVNVGPDGVATNNVKASADMDWFGLAPATVGGSTLETATDLGYVAGTRTILNQSLSEVGQTLLYKFTTLGAATVSNYVQVDFANAEGDLYLKLYNSAGTQVGATANTTGAFEKIALTGLPEGTYYVEVGALTPLP